MKPLFFVAIFILTSCASSYKTLRPDTANYPSTTSEENSIAFSYKLSVLREKGNRKYAKREDKKNIRLASVKLTNNSDRSLVVGKDILFKSGSNALMLLPPREVYNQLKQGVAVYLLYLLLTPMQLNTGDTSTPIGLVVGPGLAIGNMVGAGGANQNFLRELEKFNLIDKNISPGETVYGLIGYYDLGFNPLQIQIASDPATN